MNRRVLFFVFPLFLATAIAVAEESEKDREVRWKDISLSERLLERLKIEMEDELYPRPWIQMQGLLPSRSWNPHLLSTKEWHDLESDGLTDVGDALRHVVEEEIKESQWFQNSTSRLEDWFELKVDTYFRRPEGRGTQKELTVDVGLDIVDGDDDKTDIGIRFRKLDNPSPFVTWKLGRNGQGEKLEHELLWHPARETVEYSVRKMPHHLDFRLKYDYDDEDIEFRFLDVPFGFDRPEDWGGNFSVFHDFDDDNSGFRFGLYGRFSRVTLFDRF